MVSEHEHGQRLDNYLHKVLRGAPKSLVYRLIRKGQVRVNGSRCKPLRRLEAGDRVRIPPLRLGAEDKVIDPAWGDRLNARIVAENDDYLVLDKPAGLAVHAGSGLKWGVIDVLRRDRPDAFVELVHRLDRGTSGCLLLAKSGAALRRAQQWFATGAATKKYLCLLTGAPLAGATEVAAPLARAADASGQRRVAVAAGGKPARTLFVPLESGPGWCFAEARIDTGRTHQIRVHAAHLKRPLLGDRKYGAAVDGLPVPPRLFLHAASLELPLESGPWLVHAPLPGDLNAVLERLPRATRDQPK